MTTSTDTLEQTADELRAWHAALTATVRQTFIGHDDIVEALLLCFYCQGHALIEGPPGVGKTALVRRLAEVVALRYVRIQCTPDLMPADITGTHLPAVGTGEPWRFIPGPIFAHLVLADELNRATPRTQSAFLEAMQERHVTAFGQTYPIAAPFCVFATQNPYDVAGTYPLPEAQLDRFFMKLTVPSPTAAELGDILTLSSAAPYTGPATAPVDTDRYGNYLAAIQSVAVSPTVRDATVALVMATHPQTPGAPRLVTAHVRHGASPRAAQALLRAAQARALVAGRYHVAVDDLRHLATPVLAHRVHLTPEAAFDGVTAEAIVDAARQTALTA